LKPRPQPHIVVTLRPIAELRGDPKNARTHSKKQIAQIAAAISEFGFVNPVLVDGDGVIIAGHARREAAKQLGMDTVPTIAIHHLTPAQQRALAIADNKIAENAGWDEVLLIEALGEFSLNLDFDFTAIGFDMGEVDARLDQPKKDDPADTVEDVDPDAQPVSRIGDMWQMGEHRLLCGNALELDAFAGLMQNEYADMAATDAPYNVEIEGNVSGQGKTRHREFAMASGEMSSDEFTVFLTTVFGHMAWYSVPGAVILAFMDWRHMAEILAAGRTAFTELLNLCVWVKTNAGMGSLYRSQHELVFIFKSGKGKHINNIELGRHGRYRTNAWSYAGANTFRKGRDEDLSDHPTVKPLAMIADAIKDCSRRGHIILDPFGGSGTTLLAAERTGRRARLLEIDPLYVDVTLRRWTTLYPDRPPVLASTGQTLDEVRAARTPATETDAAVQDVAQPRKTRRAAA
jgi:DNA modification methylase